MGNKRNLAKPIINFIIKENPNVKYIYDLFGGGGSISFEAMQRPEIKQVYYNEMNTGVVNLLKDIRDNGITEKYYQWIDRETFHKHKNDSDWFGGLCKVIWSFGNNQKSYLFSKENEINKKLLHNVIVNECIKSLDEFNKKFNIDLVINFSPLEGINDRRLKFMQQVKAFRGRVDLEQLERLQQLEQLQQLQQLHITNLSYEQVSIDTPINESVIYLDPPYKSTAKYAHVLCHDELNKYIKNSPYKIYMSGYESDFQCVMEMNHRSTFSQIANNKVVEKLFTNTK